ncbi:hypothetical protein [Chlamydia pecorum]|uniref:Uncharacterized protein n=2 Tax=Chlamydia pecorum TaxID=85991 RepID=A0AA34WHK6_CHLPE|nr:hypothetical protein [Chlamydia pecorum]AEB41163.1 conserved hypothetical protein [Chlamydia pecorum E58]UFP06753.1 hypothetical protein KY091_04880 [Chlamydia pecorum]
MTEKKMKELSAELCLLKQLQNHAAALEEAKKRQVWVEKLLAMPDAVRDVEVRDTYEETPQLFQDMAKKIVEEGL